MYQKKITIVFKWANKLNASDNEFSCLNCMKHIAYTKDCKTLYSCAIDKFYMLYPIEIKKKINSCTDYEYEF